VWHVKIIKDDDSRMVNDDEPMKNKVNETKNEHHNQKLKWYKQNEWHQWWEQNKLKEQIKQ